jgi:hypothetical protein
LLLLLYQTFRPRNLFPTSLKFFRGNFRVNPGVTSPVQISRARRLASLLLGATGVAAGMVLWSILLLHRRVRDALAAAGGEREIK